MEAGVDAVQTAVLAVTAFVAVLGLVVAAGRHRDARLLTLLAADRRRLERAAARVRELADVAERLAAGEARPEAFRRAQLTLLEAQATVAGDVPNCRRLLLFEPAHARRVARVAELALEEIADLALEAEIDRDLYTAGFAWARRRRRAVEARIASRSPEAPGNLAPGRRAA